MPVIQQQVCDFYTARTILREAKKFESLVDLCEAHGISVRELEGAILLYEMDYHDFLSPLERRVSETYEGYKKAKMSQPEMAKALGTTVVQLRLILTKLGYIKSRKEKRDEIENLKHLIKTRGLKVSQALDLSPYCRLTTPEATNRLLMSGFDCYAYATAYKRYGNWLLLPARNRIKRGTKSVMLWARCLECGKDYWVQRSTVMSHRTNRCSACSHDKATAVKIKAKGSSKIWTSINEVSKKYAKKAGISPSLLAHRIRTQGYYDDKGIYLTVIDIENNPLFMWKPDIFDAQTIGERLAQEPYPNSDNSIGELADSRGLLILLNAQKSLLDTEETQLATAV